MQRESAEYVRDWKAQIMGIADYGKAQNMVVMGKHRLWESTEYGCDGKARDYGKVQNMLEMGKHRFWESAEYGSDGKVQIMGKCRIWL